MMLEPSVKERVSERDGHVALPASEVASVAGGARRAFGAATREIKNTFVNRTRYETAVFRAITTVHSPQIESLRGAITREKKTSFVTLTRARPGTGRP
jgi:ribosomal protein S5